MAGYSNTPLVKKLGIKPSFLMMLVNVPHNYWELLGTLPENVQVVDAERPVEHTVDFIHIFSKSANQLKNEMHSLKTSLKKDGMLWVSWPKKAAKVATDLNDGVVRELGLATGLVDTKVCAIDHIWSGLKFVYRKIDR